MKLLENIWNDLISSPTLMVLLGIVYVCSTIVQLITEQEIARREGGDVPHHYLPLAATAALKSLEL